ncbi:hypothetical protein X777_10672 [Ooceraea biroi]|uniref:Uncharacterized protein n=1 Tax=Ooceraea biroi TaxID=2015173 RepID=A0A026W614_OOCBI|nr:hypothetical protein X777_10672 [Ooceraea biroi]
MRSYAKERVLRLANVYTHHRCCSARRTTARSGTCVRRVADFAARKSGEKRRCGTRRGAREEKRMVRKTVVGTRKPAVGSETSGPKHHRERSVLFAE